MQPEASRSRAKSVKESAPPSAISAGASAAATADWFNVNPASEVQRANAAALEEPLPDLPGGSFPLKPEYEEQEYSLEEQSLDEWDTASFGGTSSVTGSQASSAQSNMAQKEKSWAFEIRTAIRLLPGHDPTIEQARLLMLATKAIDRRTGITREYVQDQVTLYLQAQEQQRLRPIVEDKSHTTHDPSGPKGPPGDHPQGSQASAASSTGVEAATLQQRLRPIEAKSEHAWRRNAVQIPHKETIPLWTKKFEPEDPRDKDSPAAVQERAEAVSARNARWGLGKEWFMKNFLLTEEEYMYIMSLWWETQDDWTPPRKYSREPYGEKFDDLWNIDDDTSERLPPPPPLVVYDECGTDEERESSLKSHSVPHGPTHSRCGPTRQSGPTSGHRCASANHLKIGQPKTSIRRCRSARQGTRTSGTYSPWASTPR